MPRRANPIADHEPEAGAAFLSGRMLIAMPGIGDPRFERAVILICAHSEDQAMGLRINRPLESLTMGELFDRLGVKGAPADLPLLSGGPVERERGFVVHTDDYATPRLDPGGERRSGADRHAGDFGCARR